MGPYPVRVETERLILRPWTPADGPAMEAIWRERDIWRAIRPDIPFDPNHWRDMLDRQLEHWKRHEFGLWAATDRASGEVIGWIGPSHPAFIPELADQIEIGWTMRPPFWGRGLATEGAAAAVHVAFAHLETDAVISLIHHTNERSIAVATRLGMRHSRDVLHPELGEDLRVYALSRRAWSSSSSRGASAQSTSSR
jgi:RimJ/RimL family protein N-acetyltransferase